MAAIKPYSEVKKAKDTARDYRRRLDALAAEYDYMVALWGEFDSTLLRVKDVELTEQKIAGVRIPVLAGVSFEQKPYDLFSSPVWYADGVELLKRLAELATEPRTLVLYESPYRVVKCLEQLAETMGAERRVAVVREITKRFEQTVRGTIAEVLEHFRSHEPKGEFVIVVAGYDPKVERDDEDESTQTEE